MEALWKYRPQLLRSVQGLPNRSLWEGSREVDAEAGKGRGSSAQLRRAGEDPRLLKSESKRELIKQATNPSLIKAAEVFWSDPRTNPARSRTTATCSTTRCAFPDLKQGYTQEGCSSV